MGEWGKRDEGIGKRRRSGLAGQTIENWPRETKVELHLQALSGKGCASKGNRSKGNCFTCAMKQQVGFEPWDFNFGLQAS